MHRKILVCLFLFAAQSYAQMTLTEIMFDVVGSDAHDEYIELYNLSADETIDLTDWAVGDSLDTDKLQDAGYGMLLKPNQYAVILDGSYQDNSTTYDDIIPADALIVTIDDAALGSGGLTNSKSKTISLLDASGTVVSAYHYSAGNKSGYPDEKILLSEDNNPDNWADGLVLGGTPGFRNSVTPFELDIGFEENALQISPSFLIRRHQVVQLQCTVQNSGLSNFNDQFEIRIFVDENSDSVYNSTDLILFDELFNFIFISGEELTIETEWAPNQAKTYSLVAECLSPEDQNIVNNRVYLSVVVVESRETLRINEIKFLSTENEPEWIELVNTGNETVVLKDWAIADIKDTCRIHSFVSLYPGQFKVIAADTGLVNQYSIDDSLVLITSNFPILNNDSEIIYLLNPADGWIEQVPYTDDWLEGESWREPSLERINFNLDASSMTNWGPSVDQAGATPGRENSLFIEQKHSQSTLHIEPNPFSPDADGFEDHALISYQSTLITTRMRADIFNINGQKIRSLVHNDFAGPSPTLSWNGRDDSGQVVSMGIYIVFVQILDDRNGVLEELKETIVVARNLN